ncbi:MAG TPA: hypothetical protein PK047_09305 [Saprospiraceae bacterium]|jgi:cell division protein DivIC|nr:hypothetical protein [Saprospiraceae bacterium]HRO09053.1 hypothetical protein [Saprospiraceae bacterium]HRP42400.1 hypothetical protein [Saprospiraceae bacterium]
MSKNKKIIQELASILGISGNWINKYTVVTVFFIVWVMFFDEHNVFAIQRIKSNMVKLEMEKKALNDEIAQSLKDIEDLKNNQEKFAREKHLMHLDNEEIILIEQKNKK